jgi:peptidoglycan-N-acetylglucosamine deacetylase
MRTLPTSLLASFVLTSCVLAPCLALAALSATASANGLQPCAASGTALGVSRIVEIDTSTGALFGAISTQARETRFLAPKEVILTFDDGPMPPVTRSILDTLDRFCTKATFFSVGKMALAYPGTVRNILARGHTVGSHTWSHPLNLRRLSLDKSNEEIEKGYAAVTLAAGQPVAPFFRFPGLSDSGPMLKHLQQRGIAAFTVDAVSNDSYISDSEKLLAHALKEVEAQKGGIVLFHDIKPATARMLPQFLAELQKRGYSIVHMRAKGAVEPLADYTSKLAPLLAKSEKAAAAPGLVPFYGLVKPGEMAAADDLPVTAIAPALKARPETSSRAASTTTSRVAAAKASVTKTAVRGWSARADAPALSTSATVGSWGTFVSPDK